MKHKFPLFLNFLDNEIERYNKYGKDSSTVHDFTRAHSWYSASEALKIAKEKFVKTFNSKNILESEGIPIQLIEQNRLINTDELRDKLLKYGNVEMLIDKDGLLTLYMTNFLIADNVHDILKEVMDNTDKQVIHHFLNGLHYLLLIMK